MGSPWSIISIIALYIYFVLVKGAQLMKNRVPYDLKLVIAAYNIFQIVINAFIFCAVSWIFACVGWLTLTPTDFHFCASTGQLSALLHPNRSSRFFAGWRHHRNDFVHVLHLTSHRLLGHNFLCPPKEVQPNHIPPHLPSHNYGLGRVCRHESWIGRRISDSFG